jgi:hypothetical protein
MDNPMGYTGAELQAYEMGYNEYRGDPVSREDMMMNMGYLYDTARWANILLPKLRSMAGYEDSGYGTWTELTGEAQDMAPYVLDDLISAFEAGLYQKNEDLIAAGRPIMD